MEPAYVLARAILRPWLATWFRWSMEGLSAIPPRGGAILAFNHIAYLDPFAAAFTVDRAGRRPRFLAKSQLFDDKRIAWILRGARQIEVKRGTRAAPMALDEAVDAIATGEIVVIFPEGTITTDPDLQPGEAKTGLARLALETGAPVIPGAVWGTANIWPKGYAKRWWPPRQDICVQLDTPMTFAGDPNSSKVVRDVGREVMERISVLVAGLRAAVPDRRRRNRRAA